MKYLHVLFYCYINLRFIIVIADDAMSMGCGHNGERGEDRVHEVTFPVFFVSFFADSRSKLACRLPYNRLVLHDIQHFDPLTWILPSSNKFVG